MEKECGCGSAESSKGTVYSIPEPAVLAAENGKRFLSVEVLASRGKLRLVRYNGMKQWFHVSRLQFGGNVEPASGKGGVDVLRKVMEGESVP